MMFGSRTFQKIYRVIAIVLSAALVLQSSPVMAGPDPRQPQMPHQENTSVAAFATPETLMAPVPLLIPVQTPTEPTISTTPHVVTVSSVEKNIATQYRIVQPAAIPAPVAYSTNEWLGQPVVATPVPLVTKDYLDVPGDILPPVSNDISTQYRYVRAPGLAAPIPATSVSLIAGWNLVSIPQLPTNTNPAAVLASLAGKFNLVYAYKGCDAADPWKLYDPAAPMASDLTAIDHTLGFWIEMTAPGSLDVAGTPPASTTIPLCTGWNLVGYPLDRPLPVAAALHSIEGKYDRVFAWDLAGATNPWTVYDVTVPDWANDLQTMQPGRGYWVHVTEPVMLTIAGPGTPPSVSMSGLLEASIVTAPQTVTVSATGPTPITWVLETRLAGEANWSTAVVGDTRSGAQSKVIFDPTLLLNGIHEVRFTATDIFGQSSSTSTKIIVEGEQKVGNFSISFIDLEIPLAGLPIQIIRTYDSRDKRVGDFGVGWTLSIRDVRLQENGILGENWRVTRSSGIFPIYCIEQSKPHIVTITWPDGSVHKFEPVVSPRCQSIFPIESATITFQPVFGSSGTLVPLGTAEVLISNPGGGPTQLRDFNTFQPYDANQYQQIPDDGRVLNIDQSAGLKSLVDANGNTLVISENGIIHSAGKSIPFIRDSQRRITRITDPMGSTISYRYDAQGDLVSVTDQMGSITQFTYNSTHGLIDLIDPRGVTLSRNIYDANGRLIAVEDSSGNRVEFDHNIGSRQELVRDALGNLTVYAYDVRGNIVGQTDALGNTTTYSYDSRGNQLSEIDALGNTTSYTYNNADNLITRTDPLGLVTSYTYDSRDHLLSVYDPQGRTIRYTYDTKGNLTSTQDALSNITRFTYTPKGLRSSITDPAGNVTRFQYDAQGNLITSTDALGNNTAYTYDANSQLVSETGPNGGTTSYTYDRRGRPLTITFPDTSTVQVTYDSVGNQTAVIDQNGNQTRYNYDEQGRLIRTTYPDNTTESSTYDANGNLLSNTNRSGHTTSYTYDPLGRHISTSYPDGSVIVETYDKLGQVIAMTDERGNATEYRYDAARRRTEIIDAIGNITTFAYNSSGSPSSVTDALGNIIRYEYDANNRLTRTLYPDGTEQTTEYDELGREVAQIDQSGQTTQFAYDGLDQLTSITDALGQTTTYTYDVRGNLSSQTDANGHTTHYEYDLLGRRLKRTLPMGQLETYTYNATGNLETKTDFNGYTTTYAYDNMNRLTSKEADPRLGEPEVLFTYTSADHRASMVDATGTTTYSYDARERLINKVTPYGTLEYTYDTTGNLTSIQSSNVNGASIEYTYDALNRLLTVSDRQVGSDATVYSYDSVGNLAGYTYPNGVQASYTYDGLNRLTLLTATKDVSTLASYAYTLGPAGHRLNVSELGNRSVSYSYDALYRLTNETISNDTSGSNGSIGYTYDAASNRQGRTSTVAVVPSATYTYDANDRLTTDTYDANGNTITSAADTFAYDFENRLTYMNGNQVTVTYDGDGNLVAETVNGVSTRYLVDDRNPTGYAQVLEEIVGTETQRVYVYGHDLISQNQRVDDNWTTHFYGYDGHGNVRFLTDIAGAVTDTYNYDAFGNLLASTGATDNPYLFAGERFDENLKLYHLRARYLAPSTGRFWSADVFEGGLHDPTSLHKYLYAHSDPANNIDPSGNFSLPDIFSSAVVQQILHTALVSAAVGGVFGGVDSFLAGENVGEGIVKGMVTGALLGPLARIKFLRPLLMVFGTVMAAESTYEAFEDGNIPLALFRGIFFVAGAKSVLTGKTLSCTCSVYRYRDPKTGKVSYVGITNAFLRRFHEHMRRKKIQIEEIPGLKNLSRSDAKAIEQVLIEIYGLGKNGGQLLNKINSISRSNPEYAASLQRGWALLESIKYQAD